jgi:hypothetical protein
MNWHKRACTRAINKHGKSAIFKQVQEGVFDANTLTTTNTQTSYNIKAYRNHIIANQYNFPNLVGKDTAEFYISNDGIPFTPKVNDIVEFDSVDYTVQSIRESWADTELCLFRVVCTRN